MNESTPPPPQQPRPPQTGWSRYNKLIADLTDTPDVLAELITGYAPLKCGALCKNADIAQLRYVSCVKEDCLAIACYGSCAARVMTSCFLCGYGSPNSVYFCTGHSIELYCPCGSALCDGCVMRTKESHCKQHRGVCVHCGELFCEFEKSRESAHKPPSDGEGRCAEFAQSCIDCCRCVHTNDREWVWRQGRAAAERRKLGRWGPKTRT